MGRWFVERVGVEVGMLGEAIAPPNTNSAITTVLGQYPFLATVLSGLDSAVVLVRAECVLVPIGPGHLLPVGLIRRKLETDARLVDKFPGYLP